MIDYNIITFPAVAIWKQNTYVVENKIYYKY